MQALGKRKQPRMETKAKLQEGKVEKMKAEDADNYAIKKQREVAKEPGMVLPDCQHGLEAADTDPVQLLENKRVGRS